MSYPVTEGGELGWTCDIVSVNVEGCSVQVCVVEYLMVM